MKQLTATVISFSLLALGFTYSGQTQVPSGDRPQTVEITRSGSQPSVEESAEYFTGSVRINPLFPAHNSSRDLMRVLPLSHDHTTMTHIAIQEQLDGRVVNWMG